MISAEFDGLWDSLVFDSDVKTQVSKKQWFQRFFIFPHTHTKLDLQNIDIHVKWKGARRTTQEG
jgi:hypothetical protein